MMPARHSGDQGLSPILPSITRLRCNGITIASQA